MVYACVQNAQNEASLCCIKMVPFRPGERGGGVVNPEKLGEKEKWQTWIKPGIN